MTFPAFLMLLQAGFVFSEIQPWRWSEGRGEFIPALSAVLDNRTGQDFLSVRFLVRVRCAEGGAVRDYPVLLRDILMGPQRVDATAFEAIGALSYCSGAPEIIALETTPYPEQQRPAFLLFGFSRQDPAGKVSTDLEGILDYRHYSDTNQSVELRSWRRHGARITIPDQPDAAFYLVRVPPGRLGLAGFVVEPATEPRSQVSRFLRFYDVPPGTAAYLGVFRLEELSPGKRSLQWEPRSELLQQLSAHVSRPVVTVLGKAPAPGSALVTQ
jgi:hypothetical protein